MQICNKYVKNQSTKICKPKKLSNYYGGGGNYI